MRSLTHDILFQEKGLAPDGYSLVCWLAPRSTVLRKRRRAEGHNVHLSSWGPNPDFLLSVKQISLSIQLLPESSQETWHLSSKQTGLQTEASLPDEVSQTSLHLQGTCRVDLGRQLKMFKVWMTGMIQTNEQLRASAVLGTGRLTSLQSRLPWVSSGA